MTWGVDYPWSHPSPAAIAQAGAEFAMRYLSTDQSKNLTAAEANALAAAGVWSGVVWETTAGRALAGQAAGADDARAAAQQAAACGMPDSRPIYFAVDTDTSWSSVRPYFAGVASVLGPARTGVYGGLAVIQGAAGSGLVDWYWQTTAWSGGVWDPRAHLRQLGSVTVGGVDCDRNTAQTADYGQWMPGRTPITAPQEDYMDSAAAEAWFGQLNAMLWGVHNDVSPMRAQMNELQQQLAAQGATISTLAGLLGAQHDGVDTAQVVAAVQQAIAAAVVHVDVAVTQPPAPQAAPAS